MTILARHLPGWLLWLLVLALHASVMLAQRPISGRVINGTTNQPAVGQKVELLTLAEGMKTASEALSGPDGSFVFSPVENAQTPHLLLRAIYQGVNYNLSVSSETQDEKPVIMTIYETTQKLEETKVSLPVMLVQASGNALLVQQQYLLTNDTNPKKTLVNSHGTFLFDTPPPAITSELSVSVVGLAGIPLPQQPILRSEGGYQINYPMKPGVNEIRVSYRVNYPTSQREFKHHLFYGTKASRILVLPPQLQVSGAQLKPEGKDPRTQAAMYQASEIAKGGVLDLKIFGDAPEVSTDDAAAGSEGSQPQVRVVRLPNPVFEQKEIILGSLGVLFALAIIYALRQRSRRSEAVTTAKKKSS